MAVFSTILSLIIGYACAKLALDFWHSKGGFSFLARVVVASMAVSSIILINVMDRYDVASIFAVSLLAFVILLHKTLWEHKNDVV